MRSLNECQQIVLQRSFCRFCLQQLLLEHHGYDVLRDTTGQLKPATTSTIPMDDISIISELLRLDAQTTLTSRPPTDNIANHIKLATALGCEREPLACVGEESVSGFQ